MGGAILGVQYRFPEFGIRVVLCEMKDSVYTLRSSSAIALAHEVSDQATVDLLIQILKMEEDHLDWGEAQRDQIEQMGMQNYLANQTEGASH